MGWKNFIWCMRPLEKPFEEFGDVRLKAIIMRRRQTRTHACTAAGDCFERVKDIQTCFKAYKVVARGRKADPVKVLLSVADGPSQTKTSKIWSASTMGHLRLRTLHFKSTQQKKG
ncbi:hypothetical protein R6Q59_017334, partial [Mikania micrantha]